MSVRFKYTAKFMSEPRELQISKQRVTYFDAKEAIEEDLQQMGKKVSLIQIEISEKGRKIINTDLELSEGTILYITIKENKNENNEDEKNKQIKQPTVFVQQDIGKLVYTPNIKARKQIPKQLADNYVCKRCGQKGHHVKECPQNGNRNLDKKEAAGLPLNMYEIADENDPNARVLRRGNQVFRVKIKDSKGERFAPTIQNTRINEVTDIPTHLQCKKCHHILKDAVILACCKIEICGECLRDVNYHQKCTSCGKEIDLIRDIIPNIKTRELVDEYWQKMNAELARTSRGKDDENNEMEEDENNDNLEETNQMEEDVNLVQKEDIKQIPIDDFFTMDIRDMNEKGMIVDPKQRYVWSLYKTPCPKPFDGILLFSKRNKTVEEIFEEGKAHILELKRKMEEEQLENQE